MLPSGRVAASAGRKEIMKAKEYEYKGQKRTVKEWSALYGIPEYVLHERIRRGYGIERALTEPVKRRYQRTQGSVPCPYPNCDDCPYPDCRW